MIEEPIAFPKSIDQPATRALNNAGYTSLDQLHGVSAAALLALHGFGPRAIERLAPVMAEHGWALGE